MKVEQHRCSRRGFLGLAVPACAVTCLALERLPAAARETQTAEQAAARTSPHPFDQPMPRALTFRERFSTEYSDFIPLTQYLTRTLGRERGLQLLEAYGAEQAVESARRLSQRMGGNDFAALKRLFSPEPWGHMLTFEVAESTDRVHELNVTECLWAQTWLGAGAGAEGFAAICHGDYAFAKAFNPDLEMVRDKTLMQGHACCNHRYLWEG
jgi:hypothetical protein